MRGVFRPEFHIKTDAFLLKGKKNNFESSRFAFIVSKKIDKRATVRNKTKRLYRACLESLLPTLASGYDMLFIAKKSLDAKEAVLLCEQIKNELAKKHITKKTI